MIDLGAAPGGWAQYVSQKLQGKGRIIALDILAMEALPGVDFIQGDFRLESVFQALQSQVAKEGVDLLLSDMAPNFSGTVSVDIPRAMLLAELALDLASKLLRPGGTMVVKVFQGAGFEELVKAARELFGNVTIRKPMASRSQSREMYLLAKGFNI